MVHDDEPVGLDGVQVRFDDERVVSDAGIVLVATLARRLGFERLVDRFVRLRRDRPGAGNAGRKVMALIFAMALGADSIDDCDVLRAGRTRRLLGGWLPAPSTLGTFLRAFTFGHVRQLGRVFAEALRRAWAAGAGPGDGRLVVDVDSFVGEVHGHAKQGAAFGYTRQRGYHPMLATRADSCEVLHVRLRKGSAASPRGVLRFVDELIARVARAGATGPKLLRADSAFWNKKLIARLERAGWQYSIGVRLQAWVPDAIGGIPESDWQSLEDYSQDGEAQIAETSVAGTRLVVRRTRLVGAQAELWPDWRHLYSELRLSEPEISTSGEAEISCVVANTGSRAGAEIVQLYIADPVAQVTRPVKQLAGFARVPLAPGDRARVTFRLHAERTAFTGIDLRRVVEPGEIEVMVGASSEAIQLRARIEIHGPPRAVGHDRRLTTPVSVEPL